MASNAELHPRLRKALARYWRTKLRITLILLAIWAFSGLGLGILFADWLNVWHLGGFPLGFWFAQQGSIIVFVLLTLAYALLMNRLDRAYKREVMDINRQIGEESKA